MGGTIRINRISSYSWVIQQCMKYKIHPYIINDYRLISPLKRDGGGPRRSIFRKVSN
ncbi:hypothetical protein HanHA300_Chr02g0048991 [Helianthus annuus]|nr:hypothetical protein HanHA300_Chr02g0048991 [Helianthus annuus]